VHKGLHFPAHYFNSQRGPAKTYKLSPIAPACFPPINIFAVTQFLPRGRERFHERGLLSWRRFVHTHPTRRGAGEDEPNGRALYSILSEAERRRIVADPDRKASGQGASEEHADKPGSNQLSQETAP
jgi:hypothetical protein